MNPFRTSIALLAAAAVFQGSAALAAPTYQGSASTQDFDVIPVVTDRAGGLTSYPTGYLATAGGSHAASLSQAIDNGIAEASATSAFDGTAGAFTEIRYLMTLVALPGAMTLPDGRIPVRFIASGEADAKYLSTGSPYGTSFNASASYEALFDNETHYIEDSASTGPNSFGGSFLLDQIVELLPGAQVQVIIDATAAAGIPGGDAALAHAYVDPQYLIDPAFAAFYYFDGLPVAQGTPGSTVPEPATGWLLAVGAVVCSGSTRLRQRRPSPARPTNYPFNRLCAGNIAVR